ncbi:MAG: hypothetical protein R3D05_07965 [Dongiaceae bacterium]
MGKLSILIVSALLGCSVMFGAAPAHALKLEDYKVEQWGLDQKRPQIRVVFDLQADNWNAATDDAVVFKFRFHAKLRKSYALAPGSDFHMYLDNMTWGMPLQSSVSWTETFDKIFEMKKSGNKLSELKNLAVNACRQFRSSGGKPNKDHVIKRDIEGSAWIQAQTIAPAFNEVMEERKPSASYDIVCMANPDWHQPIKPAEDFTADKGGFKIESIDLFLTTFQGQETNPNPGSSCKKLKVTVRIETNKVGGVQYKVWRQPGDAVTKSQVAKFQTEGQFKGRFIIEDTFVETFDKTTYVQYMAEVTSTAFGPSTQWKPITIQCGGGFTTGQPQGGAGELIPQFKVTSADLKIIGIEGKGCPTKAFVTATFFANKPGTFKYFIGTSLNKTKSGEAEAKKVGNVYRAQETLTVDITQSGKLTAHARAVDFPSTSVFASKPYNCAGVKPVQGITN